MMGTQNRYTYLLKSEEFISVRLHTMSPDLSRAHPASYIPWRVPQNCYRQILCKKQCLDSDYAMDWRTEESGSIPSKGKIFFSSP
jgi:hypothetical protein